MTNLQFGYWVRISQTSWRKLLKQFHTGVGGPRKKWSKITGILVTGRSTAAVCWCRISGTSRLKLLAKFPDYLLLSSLWSMRLSNKKLRIFLPNNQHENSSICFVCPHLAKRKLSASRLLHEYRPDLYKCSFLDKQVSCKMVKSSLFIDELDVGKWLTYDKRDCRFLHAWVGVKIPRQRNDDSGSEHRLGPEMANRIGSWRSDAKVAGSKPPILQPSAGRDLLSGKWCKLLFH